MTNKFDKAVEALKECADEHFKRGYGDGHADGRKSTRDDAHKLVATERERLLDQGREEGRNAIKAEIEVAREEGRVMGVEEGHALGKTHADKAAEAKGYKEGEQSGKRAGYKAGRGEGYKNGWNDAINSPPSAHKPK